MAAARRKFVIKRHTPTKVFTADKAKDTWTKLKSAIEQIQDQNASRLSFEELYRYSYNLVLYKHGQMLYDGVTLTVRDFLQSIAEAVARSSDNMLLEVLQEKWQMHQLTMKMIRDILMYMDRTYVQQSKSLSVYEMGLREFRNVVLRHVRVGTRARSLALAQIHDQRSGEQVDTSLLRGHLRMLVELGIGSLGVYESEFESSFLRETRTFYREEAQELLTSSTCPEYLRSAEVRVLQERERVSEYLDVSTGHKLRTVVEQELIETHAASLLDLDTGILRMLDSLQIEHLGRLYSLFGMVRRQQRWSPQGAATSSAGSSESKASDGPSSGAGAGSSSVSLMLTPLGIARVMMQRHLESVGGQLLADSTATKDPVDFVRKLLELRAHYQRIVSDAFHGSREMDRAMRDSFEKFLNVDHRCAQFLSLYVDAELRTGFRGRTSDEIDHALNCVILLFRYLRDKDVFETFYKQHLQKRLLGGRSASDEAERMMIAKLKSECGYQFTSNIEGMFTDLTNSKALMTAYTKVLRDRRRQRESSGSSSVILSDAVNGVDLHSTVLTTVHWPNSHEPACKLPDELAPTAKHFKDWYLGAHSGRLLRWHTSQGTADVSLKYASRRYEIVVSTYQLAMLCQYNGIEEPSLTYRQILDATGIPDDECKRHLLSLTTPMARILIKVRKGKEIKADDVFQLNPGFKSPKLRNRIKLITMRSATGSAASAGGVVELPAHVLAQRNNMIDAAVVRIMKSRKNLQHVALIAETTRQLSNRFQPDPQVIRKRIENLIDRDYLERDDTDGRLYHYIA